MKALSIPAKLTITYIFAAILVLILTPSVFSQFARQVNNFFPSHQPPVYVQAQLEAEAETHTPPAYVQVGFSTRAIIGMTVIALAFGFLVGHSITRRVKTLADGARRITAGDLEARVPVRGNDELAQLAATFNEMAARLQESLSRQQKLEQARRDLVANVAHDLRTPLAAVQAAAEALEEGVVENEATTTQYLAAVSRETRYLGRLIDDLFALSRLEAGQFELKPEPVYLEDLMQDCLTGLLPQIKHTGISLTVDLSATLPPIWADPHATRRVLINLLRNALAFTPTEGRITIRGGQVASGVEIQVSDTGIGVPPEDLAPGQDGHPRIFERFYRDDQARTGSGSGLGLAIAKELVQAQGGQIWAESIVGEGTTIGFTLPRAEQA